MRSQPYTAPLQIFLGETLTSRNWRAIALRGVANRVTVLFM
ncbi:hypothetical protein [Anabaena sp. UHCC 0451]|nr:hypothetical protein [Anabaena sp. UHCC 0451]MEA5578654.1 hypothetical protein [Anabaena sp. UHCC 0451]